MIETDPQPNNTDTNGVLMLKLIIKGAIRRGELPKDAAAEAEVTANLIEKIHPSTAEVLKNGARVLRGTPRS